jgi:hypothetical protein
MADQLATPSDLASHLQQDVDTSTATLLIECATAVVQQMCGGQRIVQVTDDVATILGTSDSWLDLPQIPVTAVTSVVRDGTTLAVGVDYKVFGNRLWSRRGWQSNIGWPVDYVNGYGYTEPAAWRPSYGDSWLGPEPGAVTVTYTHGYAPGAQQLQLARDAVLSLIASTYTNPSGASSESIDDYTIQYAHTQAAMHSAASSSTHLQAALRKQYGRRGGLVRIG